MNKALQQVATDNFVRYAKEHGIGQIRLSNCMERCGKECISIEQADSLVYKHLKDFADNNFETQEDAKEFISEFEMPKGRYFHNVASCLWYIAEQDFICGGDKIEFAKKDFDDDTIDAILVLNECNDIIRTFIIL